MKNTQTPSSSHRHIIASFIAAYLHPRLLAILALGFASGLPLALTASTLSIWLTEAGVDKAAIGLFAAVATPYAFKFLWSPLVDGLRIPLLSRLLGQRRAWLILTELLLMAALVALGFADPAHAPGLTALLALLVATLSATQDIVIDAYRVELLKPEQQGEGAAMIVLGYRLGMIISSAGALFLASYGGWTFTYCAMALLVPLGAAAAMLAGEPEAVVSSEWRVASETSRHSLLTTRHFSHWLREHVIAPFADFMMRPQWALLLLFILLYKFGDAFMGVMTGPFLIETGFTKTQIAAIVKLYGVIATILGSFIGGVLVHKMGLMRALWIGGLLQMASNLMFVVQARAGADAGLLGLTITLENLSGGVGSAAFVAYLSSLCNLRFTATQYALLSSLASAGRTWLSTPSGWAAKALGWEGFFLLSAALAVPGLAVLAKIAKK